MRVNVVANTVANAGAMQREEDFTPEGTRGGDVSEFAGRACYNSFGRPNPATASNEGYLEHIFDVGHWSVLEHGTVTLYLTEVSRSFTHELIRHRHFSYSQFSQRYAEPSEGEPVIPPLLRSDEQSLKLLRDIWKAALSYYRLLLVESTRVARNEGYTGTLLRKRAREAARAALPNMTPTQIVVTGNHRAWIEFLLQRGTEHADLEIFEAAKAIFEVLWTLEPNIYRNLVFAYGGADGRGTIKRRKS